MSTDTSESSKITLLMATYNGEKNIARQIDSIIGQSYTNWEMVVRDDGSTDGTVAIIEKYTTVDSRIRIINTASEKRGACANFSNLYAWARANRDIEYLMFTDQDDVWKPEKIEVTLSLVKQKEAFDTAAPVLAYGNLQLIDDAENVLAEKIDLIEDMQLRHVLTRNYAFGCTMMLNKVLINSMDGIYSDAENHDYWVALFATTFGTTVFLKNELIAYRQHDSNVSGHTIGNQQLNNRVKRYTSGVQKQIDTIRVRLNMLGIFYKKYAPGMSPANKKLMFDYLTSFNKGRLEVIRTMVSNHISRKGVIQTLVSYYFVLIFFKQIKYKFIEPGL